MRIAYLDCASGISGDMTLGALVDAGADLAAIQAGIDSLGCPSCRLVRTEVKKQGFRATQITVEHEPEHKHRHLHHITAMIDGSTLTAAAKGTGQADLSASWPRPRPRSTARRSKRCTFTKSARSIRSPISSARRSASICSASNESFVRPCRPGTVSSKSPTAAARFQRRRPANCCAACRWRRSTCEGELTTPTGAAIVAALADEFGPLPAMTVDRIGYGAGQKDFPQPNILRLLVGEVASATVSHIPQASDMHPHIESIVVLETNLDNATGETHRPRRRLPLVSRALDVSLTAIQMKKGGRACC